MIKPYNLQYAAHSNHLIPLTQPDSISPSHKQRTKSSTPDPFLAIRKLRDNPLLAQKHIKNTTLKSPIVNEFINNEVPKYFAYRTQQRSDIDQLKCQVQFLKGDLQNAIPGSNIRDAFSRNLNKRSSVHLSTTSYEHWSSSATSLQQQQPTPKAQKFTTLIQNLEYQNRNLLGGGAMTTRNKNSIPLLQQSQIKFSNVVLNDKVANDQKKRKNNLTYLLELHNRIKNLDSTNFNGSPGKLGIGESKEEDLKGFKKLNKRPHHSSLKRFTKLLKYETQPTLTKRTTSEYKLWAQKSSEMLKDMYQSEVVKQNLLQKQMDDIVKIALNKYQLPSERGILDKQDSIKISVLLDKSNIKDIHQELNNDSIETIDKRDLLKQIKHLNKDFYLKQRDYDDSIINYHREEGIIDKQDVVDIELYRFKFNFMKEYRKCKNQKQKHSLIHMQRQLYDKQKLDPNQTFYLTLYDQINHYLDDIKV